MVHDRRNTNPTRLCLSIYLFEFPFKAAWRARKTVIASKAKQSMSCKAVLMLDFRTRFAGFAMTIIR